jgi:hypothetical protein
MNLIKNEKIGLCIKQSEFHFNNNGKYSSFLYPHSYLNHSIKQLISPLEIRKKSIIELILEFNHDFGDNTKVCTQTVETQTVETQTVETQTVETQTVDTQTVDTQTVDTQTVETQTVDTQTVDTQTVEIEYDNHNSYNSDWIVIKNNN